MSDTLRLTSADKIVVRGRDLYTFHGIEGLNPRTLVGDDVLIDGLLMHVDGVETYAVVDPTGMNFGLAATFVIVDGKKVG